MAASEIHNDEITARLQFCQSDAMEIDPEVQGGRSLLNFKHLANHCKENGKPYVVLWGDNWSERVHAGRDIVSQARPGTVVRLAGH